MADYVPKIMQRGASIQIARTPSRYTELRFAGYFHVGDVPIDVPITSIIWAELDDIPDAFSISAEGHLLVTQKDGDILDAGLVRGPQGPAGTASPASVNAATLIPGSALEVSVSAKIESPFGEGRYNLVDFGPVDVTGATNSNAAWLACIAAWYAGGGGTIQVPKGSIRITVQTVIPSGNPSGNGMLRQPPLKIVGMGGHASGQKSRGSGGTRLILDWQAPGSPANSRDAKIVTYGSGLLVFRDIVLMDDYVGSTTPFVYTTGTTLKTDDTVAIIGAGPGGLDCAQDAFVLGGTLKFEPAPVYPAVPNYGSPDAPFQGYGSSFKGTYFNFIRRVVYGRSYTNQVIIDGCFFEKDCGTNIVGGAAIELDGTLSANHPGDPVASNVIVHNYIEVNNYYYGVKLRRGANNFIAFNGFEDAEPQFIAAVRCEGDQPASVPYPSIANAIIANQVTNGVSLSEDALSKGKNVLVDTYPQNQSVFPGGIAALGNTLVVGDGGIWYVKDPDGKTLMSISPSSAGPITGHPGPVNVRGKEGVAGSAAVTVGGEAGVDALVTLQAAAGQSNQVQWKHEGSNSWLFYDAASPLLFFRDSVNGKMHMTFTPGPGAGGGMTELNSGLKVVGDVGFYNKAPVAKQTGVPVTAAGVHAALVALGLITA